MWDYPASPKHPLFVLRVQSLEYLSSISNYIIEVDQPNMFLTGHGPVLRGVEWHMHTPPDKIKLVLIRNSSSPPRTGCFAFAGYIFHFSFLTSWDTLHTLINPPPITSLIWSINLDYKSKRKERKKDKPRVFFLPFLASYILDVWHWQPTEADKKLKIIVR